MEANLWFKHEDQKVVLGLTQETLSALGGIESIDGLQEGESFEVGDIIATITGNDGVVKVAAPTSGTVHSANELALQDLQDGVPNWLLKLNASA